jgi:hypothetical protein
MLLFQLGVFGFCNDQNRNVGVGILPERKEILICRTGFDGIALQHIGAGEAEMCQSSDGKIQDYAAMVENLLVLCCGLRTLMQRQICFPADVRGIQSPKLKGFRIA